MNAETKYIMKKKREIYSYANCYELKKYINLYSDSQAHKKYLFWIVLDEI